MVPDHTLERLLLDDVTPEERARILAALEAEEGGLERLEALRASDAAILDRYPPRVIGASLRRRLEDGPRRTPWLVAGLALAVVTLVAVPVLLAPTEPTHTYVGVKGDPRLDVVREEPDGNRRLGPDDTLAPGDVVQLGYAAMGARHGVILSLDGRGVVTLHLPAPGEGTELDPDGAIALPTAYRLDDAPGFERFVLLTSDAPVDVESTLAAARALAARPDAATAPVPVPLHQTSLLLRKAP
ncbi:MAG: hypothetical protein H6736_08470 [Alphaproteobacteria bacterium]|nr:hypothetical protein [Alphaproteobacteria bacterium]